MFLKPEISILFPIRNSRKNKIELELLHHSLNSILQQSFLDFELIVTDEQSCPLSTQICQTLEKSNAHLKYVPCNHRIKTQKEYFKLAFGVCSGHYLCFTEEDGLWHPDTLLVLYNTLIHHHLKTGMIYAHLEYSNTTESNDFIKCAFLAKRALFMKEDEKLAQFIKENDGKLWRNITAYYPTASANVKINTAQDGLNQHFSSANTDLYSLKNRLFYRPKGPRKWAITLWRNIQILKNKLSRS